MYFNTTNEINPQLDVFRKKAESQDALVEELFSENPLQTYTPSEVWQILIKRGLNENTPLTSIRRSMNTLTKGDVLAKLGWKTKKGYYGKPEHAWGFENSDGIIMKGLKTPYSKIR